MLSERSIGTAHTAQRKLSLAAKQFVTGFRTDLDSDRQDQEGDG